LLNNTSIGSGCAAVFPGLSSMEEPQTFFFTSHGTPSYENVYTDQKKKNRQLVAHGDYYGVANYRTKFSVIFGGVLEFFAVFNNVCVVVPLRHVLRNPGWETLLYRIEV